MYTFKNNLKTTLHNKLLGDATTIDCKQLVSSGDAGVRLAAWPTVGNGNFFTLTIINQNTRAFEIVKCTEVLNNYSGFMSFAVERGQEGTAAQNFDIDTSSVEHRLTSAGLSSMSQSMPFIIRDASGKTLSASSTGFTGNGATASANSTDLSAQGYTDYTSIGLAATPNTQGVAIGAKAANYASSGTAVGYNARTTSSDTVAVGVNASVSASGDQGVSIGGDSQVTHAGSVALGGQTNTSKPNQVSIAALNTATHLSSLPKLISGVASPKVAQDAANKEYVDSVVPNYLIGAVVSYMASDTYVPNGCVPANGAEYTMSQFPTFYTDYLVGGKLLTCTYAAYSTQLAASGNCAKFAVDTVNKKFRVPMLKDGDSITQAASAAELGKSYEAGLPNITGNVYVQGLTYGSAVVSSGSLFANESGKGNGVATISASNGCSSIGLNAAASSPIYGKATTVRDEQVRLRHFVVLASAQNNQSVFDWSNYMAALAGKANIDLSNITLTGKVNAGKAVAYALDYDNPVSFPILDDWVYAPVGGLMTGWIWMDPAGPLASGAVTVGNTRVSAVEKNKSVTTVSCFVDLGAKVKKDYGVYKLDIVIVPWRTV